MRSPARPWKPARGQPQPRQKRVRIRRVVSSLLDGRKSTTSSAAYTLHALRSTGMPCGRIVPRQSVWGADGEVLCHFHGTQLPD